MNNSAIITETGSSGTSLVEKMLLAVIFIIPVWPRFAIIYIKGLPDINLTRVMLFMLIFLWGLTLLGFEGELSGLVRRLKAIRGIFFLMFAYFGLRFISVPLSANPTASLYVVINEIAIYLVLFMVCVSTLKTPAQISRAMQVLVASALVVTSFGLFEAYYQHNILRDILTTYSETIELALSEKFRAGYRIQSTFANPLALAEYLVFVIPVIALFYFRGGGLFAKTVCAATVFAAVLNIWFTESRGALAAMIVMAVGFLVLKFRKGFSSTTHATKIFQLFFLVVVIVVVVIGGAFTISRLAQGGSAYESGSSEERVKQLANGIPAILNKPVLGFGPGQSVDALGSRMRSIDNYYLYIALESGLPVLALFVYIGFRFLRLGYSVYNRLDGFAKSMTGTILLSLGGMFVFMTVLSLIDVIPFMYIFFAMIVSLKLHADGVEAALCKAKGAI